MLTLHRTQSTTGRMAPSRIERGPQGCADMVQPVEMPDLPEGAETDAKIAAEVMGLTVRAVVGDTEMTPYVWYNEEHAVLVPPYTTDDVSAFQVERTMSARGWSFRVEREYVVGERPYVCTFDFGVGYVVSCVAPTAPLAICRAAYSASRLRVS